MSTATAGVSCDLLSTQCLTAEADTEFQFAAHKGVLDFCLWAFQCGRGSAQQPQNPTSM